MPIYCSIGCNFSPGRLASSNPDCDLSRAGIVAECLIGRGHVTVVADADFLNPEALQDYGASSDNQTGELLDLLATLEAR